MRFNDYQNEAVALAIYPGVLSYPTLGLCGETGELLVAIRTLDARKEVLKEAGDVLWYIANVAKDAGLTLSNVFDGEDFSVTWGRVSCNRNETGIRLAIAAGIVAENVKKTLRDDAGVLQPDRQANIKYALREAGLALRTIAETFDYSLGLCAEANLKKLQSRAARGKLHGDGDDR